MKSPGTGVFLNVNGGKVLYSLEFIWVRGGCPKYV